MAKSFADGFAAAVADVRQRLVEEGWFGRAVTPKSQTITLGAGPEQSPGERLGWVQPGETEGTEKGWFGRNFTPDSGREGQPADQQQKQDQERGIER